MSFIMDCVIEDTTNSTTNCVHQFNNEYVCYLCGYVSENTLFSTDEPFFKRGFYSNISPSILPKYINSNLTNLGLDHSEINTIQRFYNEILTLYPKTVELGINKGKNKYALIALLAYNYISKFKNCHLNQVLNELKLSPKHVSKVERLLLESKVDDTLLNYSSSISNQFNTLCKLYNRPDLIGKVVDKPEFYNICHRPFIIATTLFAVYSQMDFNCIIEISGSSQTTLKKTLNALINKKLI